MILDMESRQASRNCTCSLEKPKFQASGEVFLFRAFLGVQAAKTLFTKSLHSVMIVILRITESWGPEE